MRVSLRLSGWSNSWRQEAGFVGVQRVLSSIQCRGKEPI
jgi:hypothetical protein